ncbi:interferon-inducible double-stranded RNA-dependent protein kinase activator A homolog isoform X2 [Cylas formicarius]|uniref:interferon-inducible double-stranded RNA-dependent protein kinase activator A homolog isoform X2 n=1 Tax=Cylas formicarius TaxID=197179 RepID=UPI00295845BE|nr:interferon-inducible double-stranded RNA-dependent protein kinase activator A homolog isoform X2 [Cylas formicarius]
MFKSAVSILQEFSQLKHLPFPEYNTLDVIGESPNQSFKCEVRVEDKVFVGVGRTKKDAKANSAENALSFFKISNSNPRSHNIDEKKGPQINYVGQLNEFSSINKFPPPSYLDDLAVETQFSIKCCFAGFNSQGLGSTKKIAKQNAAKRMMSLVTGNKLQPCKVNIPIREDVKIENYEKVISKYLELSKISTNNKKKMEKSLEEEIEINTWDKLTDELTKRGFPHELELIQSNPFMYSLKINETYIFSFGDAKQKAMQSLICQTVEMLLNGFKFTLFNSFN